VDERLRLTADDAVALAGEILGASVVVVEAPGIRNLPLRGTIIDETLHLLVIRRTPDEKIVKVPKAGAIGTVLLGRRELPLNGELLRVRPEDRTKRLLGRGRRSYR
jgi:RNase P/RNase MRP subunit p29